MRIDHHGLGLGVADNANTHVTLHLVQILGKLRTEVGVLDVVNVLMGLTIVKSSHAGTLGAQMRMIIRPIEQIGDAWLFRNNTKKTTHSLFSFFKF